MQFESDLQTAEVNLRTAKIQLLMLLNDKTPVDQFDVLGLYEFSDQLPPIGSIPANRPGQPARLKGCRSGRGQGQNRSPARGGRTDRRIRQLTSTLAFRPCRKPT